MICATTPSLFAWETLEDSPSLRTLRQLLEAIPDGELLAALRRFRGQGRDDHDIRGKREIGPLGGSAAFLRLALAPPGDGDVPGKSTLSYLAPEVISDLELPDKVLAEYRAVVLADIATAAKRGKDTPIAPLALEAVRRIDRLFDLERALNGRPPDERRAIRAELAAPLLAELETWMRAERARLSRHAPVAKAMDYMLKRWDGFARFLEDGRICLTNNAAERALRGIALGRKSWLFCGSDRGGQRAAIMYGLIVTAKMNGVDPQAWLADVLARINDIPQTRLHELLPWNWKAPRDIKEAA